MEGTGQDGREMNHGSNGMRTEQPRHVILAREITRYQIFCSAWIHIDGQEPGFGSSQQATNLTPNVPAGAGDNHGALIAAGSHPVILCLVSPAINRGQQPSLNRAMNWLAIRLQRR